MTRGVRFPLIVCLLLPAAPAQAPSDELLQQVRKRVAETLDHLPDYTCRQTIERYLRPPRSRVYRLEDKLRLDVALIGGKEVYAWPGSSKFEEKGLQQIVGLGATSTGNFAVHIHNIFLRAGTEFMYVGPADGPAGAAHRFEFRIPKEKSDFYLMEGSASACVGYHGSFLVDAEKFHLLRLEIIADEIPKPLTYTKSIDRVEYTRVRIGDTEFTMPKTAEMELLSPVADSRNLTIFEGCRQYVVESVMSFVDLPAGGAAAAPAAALSLPAGVELDMNLAAPIELGKTVAGDPVTAVLSHEVKRDGKVLLPKGARFSGRLTRLERRQSHSLVYQVVGIVLNAVEAPGLWGAFQGTLEDAGTSVGGAFHVPFLDQGTTSNIWTNFRHVIDPPRTGEGVFYVRGEKRAISTGTRLVWRTVQP